MVIMFHTLCMKKQSNQIQKRCICCGRFFRPNNCVGNRQKCCGRIECSKKYQKEQQQKWRKANPGYFLGRSEYVKEWRKSNPEYQKRWRAQKQNEIQTQILPVSPIKSIPLKIRADTKISEIQNLVLPVVYVGEALWVGGVGVHRLRDTIPDGIAVVNVR